LQSCLERNKKNKLTEGQKGNLQENTWYRHLNTSDHRTAVAEKTGKVEFKAAQSSAVEKELNYLKDRERGVLALMQIMKFLADQFYTFVYIS